MGSIARQLWRFGVRVQSVECEKMGNKVGDGLSWLRLQLQKDSSFCFSGGAGLDVEGSVRVIRDFKQISLSSLREMSGRYVNAGLRKRICFSSSRGLVSQSRVEFCVPASQEPSVPERVEQSDSEDGVSDSESRLSNVTSSSSTAGVDASEQFASENVDSPGGSSSIVGETLNILPLEDSSTAGDTFAVVSTSDWAENRAIEPGKVFVGGLPFSVKGDELRDVLRDMCGKYGTVEDVRLALHQNQSKKSSEEGKHRGFAMVQMQTANGAQTVIEKLNGEQLWGRRITVSYGLKRSNQNPCLLEQRSRNKIPLGRCKVYVGNLDEDLSWPTLVNKFKEYGHIVDAKLIRELMTSRSRGFGFITFADEASAMKAILDLDGSMVESCTLRVNIAKYPQSG